MWSTMTAMACKVVSLQGRLFQRRCGEEKKKLQVSLCCIVTIALDLTIAARVAFAIAIVLRVPWLVFAIAARIAVAAHNADAREARVY